MPALVGIAYLSLFALGLIDNIRGPFYPEILRDLDLNATRGSAFFAVTSLCAVLGSVTAHRWRRVGTVQKLLLASFLFGISFAVLGQAWSFISMVILSGLFGLSFGVLNVTQNVLVCEATAPHVRRRTLNGLHAMYGVAALTAPLVATGFRQIAVSWRLCFAILALVPIGVAVMSYFFHAPKPHKAEDYKTLPRELWWKCVLFALLMSAYLWGELSISTRLVLWLREQRGLAPEHADFILAGFFLALLSGRVLFGLVHFERVSNWSILMISACMGALLYSMGLNGSAWWIVLSGFAISPFFPVMMDQASITFRDSSSQAIGFIIGTGNLSLMLMHVTIGWVSDRWGLTYALSLCAGVLLLVGVALVPVNWLVRRRRG
jgi:MFS transporter, FHS family, glucose/mannose:H+ symporter